MHLCLSLLGFGAWDHVCSLRFKPFRRMQVPYSGMGMYRVCVCFEFLNIQSLFIWQRAGHAFLWGDTYQSLDVAGGKLDS